MPSPDYCSPLHHHAEQLRLRGDKVEAALILDGLAQLDEQLDAIRTTAESIASFLSTAIGKGAPIPETLKRIEARLSPPGRRDRDLEERRFHTRKAQDLLTRLEDRYEVNDWGDWEEGEIARQCLVDLAMAVRHVFTLVRSDRA